MAEDPTPDGQAEDDGDRTVVVTFTAPGSATFTVHVGKGVALAQLYGLAWFLDTLAHEARAGDLQRQAMGQLMTAPASILDQLGLARKH